MFSFPPCALTLLIFEMQEIKLNEGVWGLMKFKDVLYRCPGEVGVERIEQRRQGQKSVQPTSIFRQALPTSTILSFIPFLRPLTPLPVLAPYNIRETAHLAHSDKTVKLVCLWNPWPQAPSPFSHLVQM